jgi:hypothetical protein
MLPVPAVKDVILSPPDVVVEKVNPPPEFVIVTEFKYFKITIPEPPDPAGAGGPA